MRHAQRWQRRPTRDDRRAVLGKAPARGVWRQLPLPALILGIPAVAALGWALPVLGSPCSGSSSRTWRSDSFDGAGQRSEEREARTTRSLPLLVRHRVRRAVRHRSPVPPSACLSERNRSEVPLRRQVVGQAPTQPCSVGLACRSQGKFLHHQEALGVLALLEPPFRQVRTQ